MFTRNKDINLLYSMTQASKKKSSSNIALVLIVLGIAIIAVVTFLFATAKVDVANNQKLLDELNDKLSQQDELVILQSRYNKLKTEYEGMISQVVADLYPDLNASTYGKMSSEFIAIVFDYVDATSFTGVTDKPVLDDQGNPTGETTPVETVVFDVMIRSLDVQGASVTMMCSVNEYEAAWAFVDYLEGIAVDATRPNLDNPDTLAALQAQLEKNKVALSGVMAEYPGLPPVDADNQYNVNFTLKFTVNWAEVAE